MLNGGSGSIVVIGRLSGAFMVRLLAIATALTLAQIALAENGRHPAEQLLATIDEMNAEGRPPIVAMLQSAILACAIDGAPVDCAEQVEARTPRWFILVERDPITDVPTVLMTPRENPQQAWLTVMCKESAPLTSVRLSGSWADGNRAITIRVDDKQPEPWTALARGGALHLEGPGLGREIWNATTLAVRAIDDGGSAQTAIFNVEGLGAESYWLTEACPSAAP